MMIPKGKLLALLLVFTAVGGVAATGAFTTVQAERTATVNTAGDANALLKIDDIEDSSFAEEDGDEVAINFNGPDNDGDGTPEATGINLDSQTLDDEVIKITNNGNNEVTITASASTDNDATVKFYVAADELATSDGDKLDGVTTPTVPTDSDERYVIDSASNGVTISSGNSVTVGLYVNVDGGKSGAGTDDIFTGDDPVTITADATTTGTAENAADT
jgi:hypothetical protein